jgi:hypothetical protein
MIALDRLRVSLTKNGYQKIADVVRRHERHEVLNHLEGSHHGVNIKRSQVANILGADPLTGQLPEFWDTIRRYGEDAINAFTLLAIILSHQRLIELFKESSQGGFFGSIRRSDLTEKEYTNLVYAMTSLGLCQRVRGADAADYDMYALVYHLRPAIDLVRQLIGAKLSRCGWLDPAAYAHSPHGDLISECQQLQLYTVFGMTSEQFDNWLNGGLEMDAPEYGFRMRSRARLPRHPR